VSIVSGTGRLFRNSRSPLVMNSANSRPNGEWLVIIEDGMLLSKTGWSNAKLPADGRVLN